MGFYSDYVLPKMMHFTCSAKPNMRQRQKIVPRAHGRVLEVGVGSGLNLPFYDPGKVEKIWGLDPSEGMRKMAAKAAETLPIEVEFIGLPGEEIPLEDDSVDTVLSTFTLCSIPDAEVALRHMARVLKPGGELLFCEHGAAPDANVRRWQDRINPFWKWISGGCHLNRDIPEVLRQGGFRVDGFETMYLPGPRIATFNYWGSASPL
jgi:ubiquinone/menaquinone biosynthesis C-methylase UbiE